jgi:hypothetical protein
MYGRQVFGAIELRARGTAAWQVTGIGVAGKVPAHESR